VFRRPRARAGRRAHAPNRAPPGRGGVRASLAAVPGLAARQAALFTSRAKILASTLEHSLASAAE